MKRKKAQEEVKNHQLPQDLYQIWWVIQRYLNGQVLALEKLSHIEFLSHLR